jgi:hypothetical protein
MRPTVFLLTLSLLLLLSGCQRTSVLNEKKMEAVLYDLHLADALIDKERQKQGLLSDSVRNSIYAAAFEKHKITKAQFDTSLSWYGQNLDKYIRIYKNLTTRYTEEFRHYDQIVTALANRIDTMQLWKTKPQALFTNRMFPLMTAFNDTIPADTRNNDTFTLSFRVFGINEQMERFPRVMFALHYADTTDVQQLTLRNDSLYTLTFPVIPNKKPDELSGYFSLSPYEKNYYRILFDDISLIRIRTPHKP